MPRALRVVLIVAGLLLAIAVLVAVAVVVLVDPNEYRGAIEREVEKRTGRTLVIDGSLSLDLLPCCGIAIGRTSLSNPPGFREGTFASVETARLGLRLWPLLTRREVEIGEIRADGLDLNLVVRADGVDNWTFEGADEDDAADEPADGDAPSFSVAGIRLLDGTVTWTDEGAGSRWRLDDIELTSGPLGADRPVDAETRFRFADLGNEMAGQFSGRATVAADLSAGRFAVTDLLADVDVLGASLPAEQAVIKLRGAGLDVETEPATRATLREGSVDIDVRRMRDVGDIGGKLLLPSVRFESGDDAFALVAPELSGEFNLSPSADSPLAGSPLPVRLAVEQLRAGGDPMVASVGAFTARADVAGAPIEVEGQGSYGEAAEASGRLRIEQMSPRELMARLGQEVPETADPAVLGVLSGGGAWFLKGERAGLENMEFRLDDSVITGSASTALDDEPEHRFDVAIDRIDLDRYLEPDAAGDGGAGSGESAPTELPLDTLRELNMRGQARIGELVLAGVSMKDVNVNIRARDGRVQLDPLSAGMYGGRYAGKLGIDATGPRAQVNFDQRVEGANLGALLADFTEVDNLAGSIVTSLSGVATGNTDEELLRSLSGNVVLDLRDGVYQGMDLWYEIRRARALIRRESPPGRSGPVQTPIEALKLSGQLNEGVLTSDELLAQVPFLQVSGNLGLDIVKKTLDTDLQALVSEVPAFEDGTRLDDLANMRIPLSITGTLDEPKVRVDLAQLVRGAAEDKVRDVVREKGGRLLERLGIPDAGSQEGETVEGEAGEGAEAPAEQDAAPPEDADEADEDPVNRVLDRLLR